MNLKTTQHVWLEWMSLVRCGSALPGTMQWFQRQDLTCSFFATVFPMPAYPHSKRFAIETWVRVTGSNCLSDGQTHFGCLKSTSTWRRRRHIMVVDYWDESCSCICYTNQGRHSSQDESTLYTAGNSLPAAGHTTWVKGLTPLQEGLSNRCTEHWTEIKEARNL